MKNDYLICPHCHNNLQKIEHAYQCVDCKKKYPFLHGIPEFLSSKDSFYEGKFVASIPYSSQFKDVARHLFLRRLRFLKTSLQKIKKKKPLQILDLACGGGHELLTKYGAVVGVDISLASLQGAQKYYDHVVRADAEHLPFTDESFDVVIAMDFFGHIQKQSKKIILSEIHRVLKKGGSTIQYIEAEGSNSMQNFAQRHIDLYQKYFIDREGHVGLEPPMVILERFYGSGLIPVGSIGAYKSWLKPPGEISGRFGSEYAELYPWLLPFVFLDSVICAISPLRFIGTAISEVTTSLIDRLFPFQKSDGVFLMATKV